MACCAPSLNGLILAIDADDFAKLLAEATPRPWRYDDDEAESIWAAGTPTEGATTVADLIAPNDLPLIVAAVNKAEATLRLVEAAPKPDVFFAGLRAMGWAEPQARALADDYAAALAAWESA